MQKTLYLFASGRLQRKDNTVYIEAEEGRKYFPVESIRDIYVFGEVDLNKKLIEFFEEKEIVVHFFGYYGNYVGTFYPREHYNSGYMILKQVEHYLDFQRRLDLARRFVQGAVDNMTQVLRYYLNRGKEVQDNLYAISSLEAGIPSASSVEELMALEGNIRRHYYDSFNVILADTPFTLKGRSRRPPADPLNALISLNSHGDL